MKNNIEIKEKPYDGNQVKKYQMAFMQLDVKATNCTTLYDHIDKNNRLVKNSTITQIVSIDFLNRLSVPL